MSGARAVGEQQSAPWSDLFHNSTWMNNLAGASRRQPFIAGTCCTIVEYQTFSDRWKQMLRNRRCRPWKETKCGKLRWDIVDTSSMPSVGLGLLLCKNRGELCRKGMRSPWMPDFRLTNIHLRFKVLPQNH